MRLSKHFGSLQHLIIAALFIPFFSVTVWSTPSHAMEKSLFERLGGQAAITAVVQDFTARQLADQRLSKYYKDTDKPVWRKHLSDLICKSTGGPCQYSGRAMNRAHARLNLSDDKFNWTAEHLIASLNKFKVPKQEQDELVAIIVSLKDQIVGQ